MKNHDRLIASDSTILDQDVLCSYTKSCGTWGSTFDLDHVSYQLIDEGNPIRFQEHVKESDYIMFVVSLPTYAENGPEDMVGDSSTF